MAGHFYLDRIDCQACWHCRSFVRPANGISAARCGLTGKIRTPAMPTGGCGFWEREPGADDAPGRRQASSRRHLLPSRHPQCLIRLLPAAALARPGLHLQESAALSWRTPQAIDQSIDPAA